MFYMKVDEQVHRSLLIVIIYTFLLKWGILFKNQKQFVNTKRTERIKLSNFEIQIVKTLTFFNKSFEFVRLLFFYSSFNIVQISRVYYLLNKVNKS